MKFSFSKLAFAGIALYMALAAHQIYYFYCPDVSVTDPALGFLKPYYPQEQTFDLYVLLSRRQDGGDIPASVFDLRGEKEPSEVQLTRGAKLLYSARSVKIGSDSMNAEDTSHTVNVTFADMSQYLTKKQDKVYTHVFFLPEGKSPIKRDERRYSKRHTHITQAVTKSMFPVKNSTFLLASSSASESADTETASSERKRCRHFMNYLPIVVVDDRSVYPMDKTPTDLLSRFSADERPSMRAFKHDGNVLYIPMVKLHDHSLIKQHYTPITNISPSSPLQLTIDLTTVSLGTHRISLQLMASFRMMKTVMKGMTDAMEEDATDNEYEDEVYAAELDALREFFFRLSPALLLGTMIVSFLHMLFDFLAFKNDISFWSKRDSFVGLSAHSMLVRFFTSLIIGLYLIDNDANKMVLVSSGLSFIITCWKCIKIFRVELQWLPLLTVGGVTYFALPAPRMGAAPANEAETNSYSARALTYVGYAFLPLCIGASTYNLYFNEYKSYYSWALSSFASTMYIGGFIMMTPQLFLNYKLKSVSHLPWRVFVYKAINTFIDDFFAFIITMPTMHRISCLRDDVVFLIYLYQRWLYGVDRSRGMYGEQEDGEDLGEEEGEEKKEKEKTGEKAGGDSNVEEKEDEEKEEEEEKKEKMTVDDGAGRKKEEEDGDWENIEKEEGEITASDDDEEEEEEEEEEQKRPMREGLRKRK